MSQESFKYKSSGINKDGNHYCSRDYGLNVRNPNAYHYSNKDGSYHYSNPNGSTYHNDGNGRAVYTSPSGSGWVEYSSSGSGSPSQNNQ